MRCENFRPIASCDIKLSCSWLKDVCGSLVYQIQSHMCSDCKLLKSELEQYKKYILNQISWNRYKPVLKKDIETQR